jgi:transposase
MRFELTEKEWQRLAPLLPCSGRGRRWRDHRQVLNGLCWRARTGAPWRDVPARYGPWQTLYERFTRWRADGTWARLIAAVQADAALADLLDLDLFHLDSTNVRASRAAAGARKKGALRRSRATTRWGARAAGSAPRSTSSATPTAAP